MIELQKKPKKLGVLMSLANHCLSSWFSQIFVPKRLCVGLSGWPPSELQISFKTPFDLPQSESSTICPVVFLYYVQFGNIQVTPPHYYTM